MKQELITMDLVNKIYPNFEAGFKRAAELFSKINSFADIETYLLRGQGLSKNTYSTYLQAVKRLYEFTEGLSPFQVQPGHIEALYDHIREKQDISTAYNRIQGLKKFFRTIADTMPGYVSPFDIMKPELLKKMAAIKAKSTPTALTVSELNKYLEWLKDSTEPLFQLAYSVVWALATTGLRAAELCNLKWSDIESIDGVSYANFLGKGDKGAHQPLDDRYQDIIKHRGEFLFYRLNGERMNPHALWYLIQKTGKAAQVAGIIDGNRKLTWSPHLMRRTYATTLEKGGMRISAIAQLTRHSSVDTLIKHYIDSTESPANILRQAIA